MNDGKVDYYVKVDVPVDRLERLQSNNREVYKHNGPIDLKEYGGKVYKVFYRLLLSFRCAETLGGMGHDC